MVQFRHRRSFRLGLAKILRRQPKTPRHAHVRFEFRSKTGGFSVREPKAAESKLATSGRKGTKAFLKQI